MVGWAFIKEKENDGPVVGRQKCVLPFQLMGCGNMIGLHGRRLT